MCYRPAGSLNITLSFGPQVTPFNWLIVMYIYKDMHTESFTVIASVHAVDDEYFLMAALSLYLNENNCTL